MLLALALAATVTPNQLTALQAQDQRVMDVAFRLSTRGTALCRNSVEPQYGIRVHVLGQYPERDWAVVRDTLGAGRIPTVLALAQDSPAARAGIRVGQAIPSIDFVPMVSRDGEGYAAVARVERALVRAQVNIGSTESSVDRPIGYRVTGTPGCASTVELIPSSKLNAKADGRIVQITTGVLAEARDDDELAFIIAHEMAHNILKHRARLDAQGRSSKNIRATEIEADALALRLMALAHYDYRAPARFWARFGAKTGYGIFSDGSHLRTKARVRLLQGEADQIHAGESAITDAQ